MQKPPLKKSSQDSYIKSAVRFPPQLHRELQDAAERNGRTMNAEIISRLLATPTNEKLDNILKSNNEMKQLIKELLDK